MAIMQLIWLPEDVGGSASQVDDWMVVLGEDMTLVASLALWLETTPCVSFGTLLASKDVKDMAAGMQSQLKVSEACPLVDWEVNGTNAKSGRPMGMVQLEEDLSMIESEGEGDMSLDVPAVATPPTPSPSLKKRPAEAMGAAPKPRTKSCAKPVAPKPSAPPSSTPVPKPSQASASPSSLSRRLQIGSGLRKP